MDWIAFIFAVIYTWLLGSKKKIAFYFGMTANVLFAIVGFQKNVYGLFALNCILVILQIRGLMKWKNMI